MTVLVGEASVQIDGRGDVVDAARLAAVGVDVVGVRLGTPADSPRVASVGETALRSHLGEGAEGEERDGKQVLEIHGGRMVMAGQ